MRALPMIWTRTHIYIHYNRIAAVLQTNGMYKRQSSASWQNCSAAAIFYGKKIEMPARVFVEILITTAMKRRYLCRFDLERMQGSVME